MRGPLAGAGVGRPDFRASGWSSTAFAVGTDCKISTPRLPQRGRAMLQQCLAPALPSPLNGQTSEQTKNLPRQLRAPSENAESENRLENRNPTSKFWHRDRIPAVTILRCMGVGPEGRSSPVDSAQVGLGCVPAHHAL